MKKQTGKRILSVTLKRMIDDSPDTSMLGEYSSRMESDYYSIDRAHSLDCIENDTRQKEKLERIAEAIKEQYDSINENAEDTSFDTELADLSETADIVKELAVCDCGKRGDRTSHEYRYFNPNHGNYKGSPHEEIRKYTRQDYERMESLNRGDWCYISIRAQAQVVVSEPANCLTRRNLSVASGIVQTITSGGLWGIESDNDKSYLESVEKDELSDLREQLKALGFSSRAISTAFKNVERKEE